jgi:membrane associated rhomboid family serine protease
MAGVFGNIANGAHVGGFLAGMLIGVRQALWKKIPFTKS